MRKSLLLLFLSGISFSGVFSQATGDYRSAASGNWSAAATWQRFDGTNWVAAPAAPSSGDGVITILNTHTITANTNITADQIVIDAGGILVISAGTFTVANGAEASDLVSNGTINFSGGTIGGAGTILSNSSFSWTGGSLDALTTLSATATMTINVTGDVRLLEALTNNGIINWTNGDFRFQGGTLTNNLTFTISNTAADLENFGSGTFTNSASGTVSKSTAGTCTNNITFVNNGTFNLTAGTFVNSSTFTHAGSFVFTATTILQNGSTMNINTGTAWSGTGSFNQTGGTANINFAFSVISTITINFSGGTIGGSGSLADNGAFSWTSGSLDVPTTLSATATMTINVTGDVRLLDALTNNGIINWTNGDLRFQGGTLTNNLTFNISNTANDFENFSSGTFTNSTTGTVTKSTAIVCINNITFNNNGSLQINSNSFTNQSTFTNTGSIAFGGVSTTLWNSSTMNLNAGTSLTGTGGLVQSGGTINFNLALNVISTITISFGGGTMDGTGSLTVNGLFSWNSGNLDVPTTIANVASASMTINVTGDARLLNILTNNRTINWNNGDLRFQGGSLTNNSIFNIMTTAADFENFSSGTFTNSATGTVSKSTAGTCTNNITFINNGTFNLTAGTFLNNSTFTNAGSFAFTATAILQNGSTININTGTSWSGTGSFNQTGGTANINFAFNVISTITINFSGGTITGSGSLTDNGAFSWTSGSLDVPTTLSATAAMTINVTGDVRLLDVLTNNGIINWTNGDLRFQGGTLTNNLTFTISNTAADLENFGSGTFTNSATGTVSKSTAGTCTNNITFINNGTFNLTAGTFLNNSTFTNAGSFAFTATTILQNGSTLNINTGTAWSGTGSFNQTGGTANINFAFNVISTITINFSGGTITGSGSLTDNGAFNWTSGSLDVPTTLSATAAMTINVTGDVRLLDALTNNGIIDWTNGDLRFQGGTLTNNLTFTISNTAADLENFGSGTFTNSATGTVSKSTAGTTAVNIIFSNSGLVKGTGTLNFTSTFTNNGTIAPGLSPGIIIIDGAAPFSANSTLSIEMMDGSGAGTGHDQMQRAGNLTLAGTLTVVETGTVPAGTYTIVSLTSGTISGVFNTVNLPADYVLNPIGTTTVTVTKGVTPCPASVSITADPGNTICAGTNVTFTATPTNGGTPTYQWKLNGNNAGTNSNTYQNNSLVNGDIVTCEMTSSLPCANPPTSVSNQIVMEVSPAVVPSVSIAADPGNTICTGTNVTFTATPVNGGASPSYQWKLNGNNVGTNSNTYQNAALANGDIVSCVMTSNAPCANPATATSNNIVMNVSGTVTPSVSITADPGNTICAGTNVTFTATPTNGGTPSYQWKLNGNNVGANSNTYQNASLVNGDVVSCVMTSSLACADPATATSNEITMTVNPVAVPSVSIAADPGNTICSGTNVTFTATPTNGGASPSYQWKLNGNNVGTNSNTYQNAALANGDIVSCVMTSNATCASPVNATSNAIAMVVSPAPTYYHDQDGDGYGNPNSSIQACSQPPGYVSNNTDCNDNNPLINPATIEVCGNQIDDDCDGQADEGCPGNDNDGDGYTVAQGDCNDNNPAINPGAAEICGNNTDDNCNNYIDENCLPDLPVITLRTYPVKEGDAGFTMLNVEVRVDRPAPTQLQLNYNTADEDAAAGLDYVATSGVLIIPAGASSATVQISIIGDMLRENNERFRLNFTVPINVVIEGDPYSRIMIIDDDKGKQNVFAANVNNAKEITSSIAVPNIVKRNHTWQLPSVMTTDNEVVIINQQGKVVFKANNYRNNMALPHTSAGIYFYHIRYRNQKGEMIRQNGKLLITE